jgi:hypothetical protein
MTNNTGVPYERLIQQLFAKILVLDGLSDVIPSSSSSFDNGELASDMPRRRDRRGGVAPAAQARQSFERTAFHRAHPGQRLR